MRQTALVIEVDESSRTALVEVSRTSACEGCHAKAEGCSACVSFGDGRKAQAKADNAIGAAIGDRVIVETESSTVLLYAALIFLLPLALGSAAYFLFQAFLAGIHPALPYVGSLAGFAAAFLLLIFVFNKKAAGRTDVKIVEIL